MIEIQIDTKPLSVNACWKGKRFKSKAYTQYEHDVSFLLMATGDTGKSLTGPLEVSYKFYLTNCGMTDVDNLIKGLQDILVKRGVIQDDRYIFRVTAEKIKSDMDRIEVTIKPYEKNQ